MCKKFIPSILFFILIYFAVETKAQTLDNKIKIDYTDEVNKNDSNTIERLSDRQESKKDLQDNIHIICGVPEQMPQFPRGNAALLKYIRNNLKPIDPMIEGRVVLRFLIDKDSIVKDVRVIRSLSKEADIEAIRVVESMPKWIPGKKNGANAPLYFVLPIIFR